MAVKYRVTEVINGPSLTGTYHCRTALSRTWQSQTPPRAGRPADITRRARNEYVVGYLICGTVQRYQTAIDDSAVLMAIIAFRLYGCSFVVENVIKISILEVVFLYKYCQCSTYAFTSGVSRISQSGIQGGGVIFVTH